MHCSFMKPVIKYLLSDPTIDILFRITSPPWVWALMTAMDVGRVMVTRCEPVRDKFQSKYHKTLGSFIKVDC